MSINYSKVKSYRMYLNYDNDKQVYILPVLPEDIQITYKGEVTSTTVDQFGEILHKGKRGAAVIKFSSFFPAEWNQYVCSCKKDQFKKPATWDKWMKELEGASKPCHLVLTKSPLGLNLYVDVTSYVPKEVGGDPGTIQYTLEVKEHREPVIRTIKKVSGASSQKSNTSKSSKKKRTSNVQTPKTYKVKSGDCLWNIAKKYYGNGAKYTKIYNANKDKIKNPNLIYPGQVLSIP